MRFTKTALFPLALALSLLVWAPACDRETNPPAFFITGNAVPDKQGGTCTVKAQQGSTQVMRNSGVLDLSLGTQYVAYLVANNAFPPLEELANLGADDARLDGANISIQSLDLTFDMDLGLLASAAARAAELGVPLTSPYEASTPAAGMVEVEGTGVIIAPIIPWNVGQVFRNIDALADGDVVQVTVKIHAVGVRQDGDKVRSEEFTFPVFLCNNCLVYDAGADATVDDLPCVLGADEALPLQACSQLWPNAGDACQRARCEGGGAGFAPTAGIECATDPVVR